MSKADVVRRRCRLRPAAALGWSPCTVCTPAGQFHSISCSTDSYARFDSTRRFGRIPVQRHFCGGRVHLSRSYFAWWRSTPALSVCGYSSIGPGRRPNTRLTACTASSLNLLIHTCFAIPHSVACSIILCRPTPRYTGDKGNLKRTSSHKYNHQTYLVDP